MSGFLVDHFETLFDRAKSGLDRRLGLPFLHRKFKRQMGYDLNLDDPKSYSEKLQWLKFNTSGEKFVRASDKLEMPTFVRELIGPELCEGLFTKIYYQTDDADTIDFAALPDSYVIKPTHGSGWLQIVTPDRPADPEKLRALCKSWLRRRYGYRQFEWPYTHIKPRIMVEELLDSHDQLGARDVKLHMFNGVIRRVRLFLDRFGAHKRSTVTADWAEDHGSGPPVFDEPAEWARMKEIANEIGKHFDCVRVDFLVTQDRFALNELTFWSNSGFNSGSGQQDFDLGSHLTLPIKSRD